MEACNCLALIEGQKENKEERGEMKRTLKEILEIVFFIYALVAVWALSVWSLIKRLSLNGIVIAIVLASASTLLGVRRLYEIIKREMKQ